MRVRKSAPLRMQDRAPSNSLSVPLPAEKASSSGPFFFLLEEEEALATTFFLLLTGSVPQLSALYARRVQARRAARPTVFVRVRVENDSLLLLPRSKHGILVLFVVVDVGLGGGSALGRDLFESERTDAW